MAEIINGVVCGGEIAVTVIKSTDIVNKAIEYFELSPVAAAALGRTLSMASIMGYGLKNDGDHLTVVLNGGGPIGTITVTAAAGGNVKGYADNPKVESFINDKGKLDVRRAVGVNGSMTVIRNTGLKEPYVGTCGLVSGEIAEDFANYFASSEQTPCGVALGVKIAPDGTCVSAGGIFASVLPGASEESVSAFEKVFSPLSNVSALMENKSAERFASDVFGALGLKILDRRQCGYVCDCSRDKIDKVLTSLQKSDVDELIAEKGEIEVVCQFCNKKYIYTKEQAYKVCGFDNIQTDGKK